MAKKGRRRERIRAPESEYRDEHGSLLVLRGALTPATRAQYTEVVGGNILSREDAWQRAVEFLFERLVVRWEIAAPSRSRARRTCSRASASPRPMSDAGSATSCARTWPSTFPTWRPRE